MCKKNANDSFYEDYLKAEEDFLSGKKHEHSDIENDSVLQEAETAKQEEYINQNFVMLVS